MSRQVLIYALLGGCGLFGGVISLEAASVVPQGAAISISPMIPETRKDLAPAPRRPEAAAAQGQLVAILARPLFSATRRPPATKEKADGPAASIDARLTAIITEPGHRVAIFAVPGAKPLDLAEGETLNGWVIESISPEAVVVSGPNGPVTLQPKVDPTVQHAFSPVSAPVPPPPKTANNSPPPPPLPIARLPGPLPDQIAPALAARAAAAQGSSSPAPTPRQSGTSSR